MTLHVVGSDFDSTASDSRHRWHMIERDNPNMDWDKYGLAAENDGPGPALPILQLFTKYSIPFFIVTGRSPLARDISYRWLYKHNVKPWAMFMGDERMKTMPHGEWKALRIKEIQEQCNVKFDFFMEDHSSVAEALAPLGIPTVLVHDMGKLSEFLG